MAQSAAVCPKTNEVCSWRAACAELRAEVAESVPSEGGNRSWAVTLGNVVMPPRAWFTPPNSIPESTLSQGRDPETAKNTFSELDRILTVNCVRDEVCIVEDALTLLPDLREMVEHKQRALAQ